jgi:hypothetical protein
MTRARLPILSSTIARRWLLGIGGTLFCLLVGGALQADDNGADHVRWDIISVDIPITTARPGGVAFASARNPNTLKIKLTGAGTFVAPAKGGQSSAVTGGGTWETFQGAVSTGRGTYRVTGLASWEFANFQAPGLIDEIGDTDERANGNAVLRIRYSDGSRGTLGIGCHGPGAPDGIVEGVIATKDYFTYWDAEPPTPAEDKNRTVFHVTRGEDDDDN